MSCNPNIYLLQYVYYMLVGTPSKNMLLAGLWYDNEKPTMATFLYPLMSSVNGLFQQGNMD